MRKRVVLRCLRRAVLKVNTALMLAFMLTACAGDPKPLPGLSKADTTEAADPRICAKIPDEPPVKGALVQPVTPEEKADFDEFASGEWAARRWGRLGWGVVGVAQGQFCPK